MFDFSLKTSVQDMWNGGSYALSILIAVLSGFWSGHCGFENKTAKTYFVVHSVAGISRWSKPNISSEH